jgi:hypothetical protein
VRLAFRPLKNAAMPFRVIVLRQTFDDLILLAVLKDISLCGSLPLTVKLFIGESTAVVPIVDMEDTDESSSSFPTTPLSKFDAVELPLFFLGSEGRTFPGNSVRSFL